METFKNIGLIVGGNSEKTFRLGPASKMKGYTLKKVLVGENVIENSIRVSYPGVEVVSDKCSMIQDPSLDLIIFIAPIRKYAKLIGEVLKSGKSVRLVSEV